MSVEHRLIGIAMDIRECAAAVKEAGERDQNIDANIKQIAGLKEEVVRLNDICAENVCNIEKAEKNIGLYAREAQDLRNRNNGFRTRIERLEAELAEANAGPKWDPLGKIDELQSENARLMKELELANEKIEDKDAIIKELVRGMRRAIGELEEYKE